MYLRVEAFDDDVGLPKDVPATVFLLGAMEPPEVTLWAVRTVERFGGIVLASSVLMMVPEPWMRGDGCPCGAPLPAEGEEECRACGARVLHVRHDTKTVDVLAFFREALQAYGSVAFQVALTPEHDAGCIFAWDDTPSVGAAEARRELELSHAGVLRVIERLWKGHDNGRKFPIPRSVLYRAAYRKNWKEPPPLVTWNDVLKPVNFPVLR